MSESHELSRLLARQQILDVIDRYARAIDRLDAELLKSVFWEDGKYVGVLTDDPVHRTADAVMTFMRHRFLVTQHCVSNVRIEFINDTRARTETYVHALHLVNPVADVLEGVFGAARLREMEQSHEGGSARGYEIVVGGRYLDTVERRSAEWRICTRQLLMDWTRTGFASGLNRDEGLIGESRITGWPTRDRTDPSYRRS